MKVNTLIVGSGVAATTISQKLLNDDPNASILILEAGQKVKMQDQTLWTDYVANNMSGSYLPYVKYYDLPYPERDKAGENLNIGDQLVPLDGSRVMTYGGSTIHWGGWSYRLKEEDFKMKSNTGEGIDWPVDYQEMEAYYCKAEDYIGVAGDSVEQIPPRTQPYPFAAYPYTLEDQPFYKALVESKMTPLHVPIARHGIANTRSMHAPCKTTGTCKYCPFGARYAAPNFLNQMCDWEHYPNFEVRTHAVVEEILMNAKDRVKGVVYHDTLKGEQVSVEAQTVIVAAGAIESPKLLMRSKSDHWPNGIGNDKDLVGRYYVTHPYFIFTGTMANNPNRLQAEMDFPTLCTRHFDSVAEQAKGKFIFINPPTSIQPDPIPGKRLNSIASMMQNGMSRAEIDAATAGRAQVQLHGMVEIKSEYKNRIMNLDVRNHLGLKETIVDYSRSPGFKQRMAEITLYAEELFKKMGATLDGSKTSISWRADHSACTCRMADSDQEGVVDRNLKLFSVSNLYVCSNAVFPNTGAINPTLTLTALSIRLAEHLIDLKNAGSEHR